MYDGCFPYGEHDAYIDHMELWCYPYHKPFRLSRFAVAFSTMYRLFITLLLFSLAQSHSYMVSRDSWWYKNRRPHCHRGGTNGIDEKCEGPCVTTNFDWYSEPVMKWKRGDRKRVKWHRDNHSNGFIRLTLVPAWDRMNKSEHDAHKFFYSCFDANRVKCDKKDYCGTGKYISSIGFDVPAVPDGDYVLGWSWFGSFSEKNGKVDYHFADYWSCTKVRIRGGIEPRGERQTPGFASGTEHGYCRGLGNRIGVCNVEPCPDAYKGKSPRPMCPDGVWMQDSKCVGPTISPSPTPTSMPTPSVAPSYKA